MGAFSQKQRRLGTRFIFEGRIFIRIQTESSGHPEHELRYKLKGRAGYELISRRDPAVSVI